MAKTIFTIFILTCCALSVTAQTVNYRLPNAVRPSHYTLELETNMTAFTFAGLVQIHTVIQQQTDTIVLHSKDLAIENITVTYGGVNIYSRHDTVNATDFLRIFLSRNLTFSATPAIITIRYNGVLGTGNVGYYRASYVNELGQTRHMAVTHLEATNARRAFPCFDQPNFKATFQITLTRSSNFITASNMRISHSIILAGNRVSDIYQTTPLMSTYLIAFMVSDYELVEAVNNYIIYRTFGRAEFIRRGDGNYSLSVAQNAINRMRDFTNINYTLNTMDQVPVPNEYYKIGAMENWGMVTYREKYLMYNTQRTTTSEKQFITTIISHELAHQWFGNLVTPEWWRYIWLNEGFATYLEMLITSQFEPSWQLMEQFVTSMVQTAFQDDALESTRPMTRDAESPAQIDAQYDTIVYEKAGSVIRMAANFLGDTAFRNGLTTYLTNRTFSNAVPQDLYDNWQAAVGATINVTNIMTSWEMQPGYPVVTVNRTGNAVQLTQERFFMNNATTNDPSLWHIPLNWLTPTTTTNQITWFNTRSATINIVANAAQWVIFNVNQMGFYRVNYDANNWLLITNFLRTGSFNQIPTINRAQLIDDVFSFARSGRVNLSTALDLGSYIHNETEYVPIVTFVNAFSHMDRLFTGRPQFNQIRNYGLTALEGYFNRTGFLQNNDTHLIRLTKVQVLTWLCRLDHQGCRNHAAQAFNSWINQNVTVEPDAQGFVYCNGMRNGTLANWEMALQRYSVLREDTQRTRIAQALGCSTDQIILLRLLTHVALANSTLTQSDKAAAITSLYTNNGELGVTVFLQWIVTSFQLLNENVPNVGTLIKGVANRITTNQQATLFDQFVTNNRNSFTPALNTTVTAAQTTLESNMQFITQSAPEIDNHFSSGTTFYSHIILLLVSAVLSFLYI